MEKVIAAAQMLGRAIQQSDIYQACSQAEEALQADPDAMALLAELQVKRRALRELQDMPELLQQAQADLNRREAQLKEHSTILRMQQAEADFDTMMANVNQVLQLMLNRSGGGCSGSCEGCGGCG